MEIDELEWKNKSLDEEMEQMRRDFAKKEKEMREKSESNLAKEIERTGDIVASQLQKQLKEERDIAEKEKAELREQIAESEEVERELKEQVTLLGAVAKKAKTNKETHKDEKKELEREIDELRNEIILIKSETNYTDDQPGMTSTSSSISLSQNELDDKLADQAKKHEDERDEIIAIHTRYDAVFVCLFCYIFLLTSSPFLYISPFYSASLLYILLSFTSPPSFLFSSSNPHIPLVPPLTSLIVTSNTNIQREICTRKETRSTPSPI